MPAALEVVPEHVAAGDVWIATGVRRGDRWRRRARARRCAGYAELEQLFVEPRHIRSGVGRALLAHAVTEARRRGAERLTILG